MKEVLGFFLKLGFLGFGGPIATLAMMEEEAVHKRGWLTADAFSRAYALIKVLPGPAATQMSVYLGQKRAGRLGGFLSGLLFILPAFLLILLISVFYERFRYLGHADALFSGMQVAALVVIAESVIRMAKPYIRSLRPVAIILFSGLIILLKPQWEPLIILFFGFWGVARLWAEQRNNQASKVRPQHPPSKLLAAGAGSLPLALQAVVGKSPLLISVASGKTLTDLAWVCFKAGAFVFGTGLAIVPMLEADVVTKHHWLSHYEFLDGLAAGQITPGPVVITATFIGYRVAGLIGSLVATLAIFTPAFLNILFIVPPFEKRMSQSPLLNGFSSWAIPAVIGGILGSTIRLALISVTGFSLLGALGIAFAIEILLKPPSWLLIPATGLGYFLFKSAF